MFLPRINIADLFVMQEQLRSVSQISKMVEFVKHGGFWTKETLEKFSKEFGVKQSPMIEIASFPDQFMIHDGHHRIVSIFLAGRTYLSENEYVMKRWNYDDYLDINFNNKWVTPFDPLTEIRFPDIYTFKKEALEIAETDKDAAITFIKARKHLYVKPRTFHTVSDLASTLREEHENL